MQVLKTAEEGREFLKKLRHDGATVGLVPTMGALHQGHYSLVHASTTRCDFTLATIFVNPTQFAPGEDLAKYPRTVEQDLAGLSEAGAAAVYLPQPDAMYPPGFSTMVRPPKVAQSLEGESRPTHFEGVATVVLKLFQILPATHAFFGQKDFQQLRVIEAMVRDLNVDIEIVGCPIVREPDGLALSSRNRYLDTDQRRRALRLSMALQKTGEAFAAGERDTASLEQKLHDLLTTGGRSEGVDSVDYARVVDSQTLEPIDSVRSQAVALVAARVGSTRLIDNLILTDEPKQ